MSTTTADHSTWTPTPEITQHDGKPLRPKLVFFAPPPPDIGPIVTAYSSVKNNGTPRRIHWHLVSEATFPVFVLAVFMGMFAFILLKGLLGLSSDSLIFTLSLLLTLLICAVPARLSLRPCLDHDSVCSYVGEQGIAEYRLTETGRVDEKVLRFANFSVLRKKITNTYRKQYSNRGWHYSGTEYCLVWGDARGESIRFTAPTNHTPWFTVKRRPSGGLTSSTTIVGTYYSKPGRPRQGDSYYLAVSAERI